MASTPRLSPHRLNKDGSSDTICLTCFATVGSCKHDGQFAQHEKAHICDSAFLAERGIFTQSKIIRQSPPIRTGTQAYNQPGRAA